MGRLSQKMQKRRRLMLLAMFVLLSTLVFRVGCSLQYHMLYFPGSALPGKEMAVGKGLQFWPEEQNYRGYISQQVSSGSRGTVVIFHGNAELALDRNYYMSNLEPLGFRVVLAEYPQYGGRPGDLGESSFVADAVQTVKLAQRDFTGPIYLWGESLGGGIAAATAREMPDSICGVVLVTPWDSFTAVALEKFVLAKPFLRDEYNSVSNLNQYPGPIAVMAAGLDEVIPVQHARNLYRQLPQPKKWWILPDSGHNNWLHHVTDQWWAEIMAFVTTNKKCLTSS